MDGYVDMLLRPNNPSPENTNSAETRRELSRLLTADFRNGAEPLRPIAAILQKWSLPERASARPTRTSASAM
jgi:hypothetical protein